MKNRNNASLFMSPTDPQEIASIISQLKNQNTKGIDNISSNLLKKTPINNKPTECPYQ